MPIRDIPLYIGFFKRGLLPVNRLISNRLTLDKINLAFDQLDSGNELRQLITFGI